MKTEILVRCYTPELLSRATQVVDLIRRSTSMTVREIDHTGLSLTDFDLGNARPVSIDRHLAEKFQVPYFQVSRVFDLEGEVAYREVVHPRISSSPDICIIDTDICEGLAIDIAKQYMGTNQHSVRLVIEPHQDLIDIEDLCQSISLFKDGLRRPYLCNPQVFTKRTSLSQSLYGEMLAIFADIIDEPLLWKELMWRNDRGVWKRIL